jgi:anti-sigma B factor antagonist
MRPHPIDIRVTIPGDEIVLEVSGEIDMATAPMLASALDAAPPGHRMVVLDLSAVGFMGSCGVATILQAREVLAGRGQDLVLRLPSPPVRRVLELTGITELLEQPSSSLRRESRYHR